MVTDIDRPPSPADLLDYAIAYAAGGYCMLPLHRSADRAQWTPVVSWRRYRNQRPAEADIRRWFRKFRVDGIGFGLGTASSSSVDEEECGLVCREFSNLAAFTTWIDDHPDLALKLPTVTAGGIWHIYCRTPISNISCAHSLFFKAHMRPGAFISENAVELDDGRFLAGDACYVAAPPTFGLGGYAYRWFEQWGSGPTLAEIPAIDLRSADFFLVGVTQYSEKPAEGGVS